MKLVTSTGDFGYLVETITDKVKCFKGTKFKYINLEQTGTIPEFFSQNDNDYKKLADDWGNAAVYAGVKYVVSHAPCLHNPCFNEEEYKAIVNADENTKHYVYMLQIDYSTDDCQGVETHIFATRYQAVEKFKEQIEFEKKQTWIQDAYENDKLLEGYELDQNTDDDNDTDLWWNMSCHHDFYLHTFIDMKKMEVK